MITEQNRDAIEYAKEIIQARASKGEVKNTLIERFCLKPSAAGGIIRIATRELYDRDISDPSYWLSQMGFDASPLQRRFARKRYRELMPEPEELPECEESC